MKYQSELKKESLRSVLRKCSDHVSVSTAVEVN